VYVTYALIFWPQECSTYMESVHCIEQIQTACSYCTCLACERLDDASLDEEFSSIRDAIFSRAASGRKLSELVSDQHDLRVKHRRRLQQLSSESVTQLLGSVNSLRESQSGLKTQVTTLSTQVQEANQAAEERAKDKTLENLINAGRQDILLGQSRVETLLTQIIGKQNQALASAELAQAALQAITYLAEKRSLATSSVSHAVEEQLTAIKQAAQQNLLTLPQCLVLWKRARRDREAGLKEAILSNTACSTERVDTHDFGVWASLASHAVCCILEPEDGPPAFSHYCTAGSLSVICSYLLALAGEQLPRCAHQHSPRAPGWVDQ
jgi:hypothetical protein